MPNQYCLQVLLSFVTNQDTINDSAMRETMKDYFLNTGFRKDVFVRGARKLSQNKQAQYLSQFGMVLTVPRAEASLLLKLSVGEINGKAELFLPVLDALAQRPHTLAELKELPDLRGQSLANLAQVAALLATAGQAMLYFEKNFRLADESALAMNRNLADMTRYADEYQAMCSPLLANGLTVGYIERLVYLALSTSLKEADAAAITSFVWTIVSSHGRRMLKDGVVLESEVDNLAELSSQVARILNFKLPLWRQLRMI